MDSPMDVFRKTPVYTYERSVLQVKIADAKSGKYKSEVKQALRQNYRHEPRGALIGLLLLLLPEKVYKEIEKSNKTAEVLAKLLREVLTGPLKEYARDSDLFNHAEAYFQTIVGMAWLHAWFEPNAPPANEDQRRQEVTRVNRGPRIRPIIGSPLISTPAASPSLTLAAIPPSPTMQRRNYATGDRNTLSLGAPLSPQHRQKNSEDPGYNGKCVNCGKFHLFVSSPQAVVNGPFQRTPNPRARTTAMQYWVFALFLLIAFVAISIRLINIVGSYPEA